jgi:site-specific DNA-methyltransferase (adenine-specific)
MLKAGCPVDGLVLDPFIGSGTTAIVARGLGMNYIGFEINPDYCNIAEKRLSEEAGVFG